MDKKRKEKIRKERSKSFVPVEYILFSIAFMKINGLLLCFCRGTK